jgi:hypothetical protein
MRPGFNNATSIVFFVIILAMTISGCNANPENVVKKGTLQIDTSTTVGDALNGYQFFGDRSWKVFEDPQKRQIVEFNGTFDYNKFADTELLQTQLTSDMVKKAKQEIGHIKITYEAQFAVSKDGKTFDLKYSGTNMSGTHKGTGEMTDTDIPDNDFTMIKYIYANKPEPSTWAFLYSSALFSQ